MPCVLIGGPFVGRARVGLTFSPYCIGGARQYVVERHGETLLPQYLGLYRITVNDKDSYCMVMRNVLSSDLRMHKVYDLKGSTVDRAADDKELAKEVPTFKDNDFTTANEKIFLGPEAKAEIMARLKLDVDFLCRLHLMDYSLLVGIHEYDMVRGAGGTGRGPLCGARSF